MAHPMLCTCCTPPSPLLQSHDETAEPRCFCPTSTSPYTLRDGVLVRLAAPRSPWDETTAGRDAVRAVRVDLSREGYA